jgi:hypothetical protein
MTGSLLLKLETLLPMRLGGKTLNLPESEPHLTWAIPGVFVSWQTGLADYEGMVTTNLIMGNKFLQTGKTTKIIGKKVIGAPLRPGRVVELGFLSC